MLRSSFLRRVVASGCVLALALAGTAAAQYQGGFGKNKVQYRDFKWKTYKSPHFVMYYYQDEEKLLEKVVSFAESAYDRLSREFDHQIQEPIPLIFYATHSAFEQNNIIVNFIPEDIGAFASPVRNRMVMPVDLPDGELFELIMHELTHIFQYSVIFQGKFGRGPGDRRAAVVHGGHGVLHGEGRGHGREDVPARLGGQRRRARRSWSAGCTGYIAYRFGHAAFDFIEERWGKEGFRDFVYEFRNTIGGRPDKAIERVVARSSPTTSTSTSAAGCARSTSPSWWRPASRRTSAARSATRRARSCRRSRRPPRPPATWSRRSPFPTATSTSCSTTRASASRSPTSPRASRTSTSTSSSQHLTSKARMGRDLAFSPDGNRIAVFAKREKGRSLVIFDVLRRKIERVIDMEVEQQHAPAFNARRHQDRLLGQPRRALRHLPLRPRAPARSPT